MLIAPTVPRRRRLCFPVAALENFGPTRLCYSPRQLASQPTWPSSLLRVAPGAPVKDSVFSSLPWQCSVPLRRLLAPQTSFGLTLWLGQPISSPLSMRSLTPPPAICVSAWPVFVGPPADDSQVVESFSLTSSTSSLSSFSPQRRINDGVGVNDKIPPMSRHSFARRSYFSFIMPD